MFTGNLETCLKISPGQINRVVQRAAQAKESAPEFVDLLCAIVKIEELGLPLKRNQAYVMKYVMESYIQDDHVLKASPEVR